MGKIKIGFTLQNFLKKNLGGLIILGSIALVGLVVAEVVMANFELRVANSENRKVEFIQDEIIVRFKGDIRPLRVIKVPQGKVEEKVREYLKRTDVEYAEPNYIAYTQWTPNDPYYKYQWHFDNPEYGGIQMEKAWEFLGAPGTPGSRVAVAIVDTGIRKGTDLVNTCFVSGYNFVNNNSDTVDNNGHGTHVAGTIAQSTNNNFGTAGVAFNACLMPVKVLDDSGAGSYANIALGIRYAVDNGAKVINLSLGGPSESSTLKAAVDYAYEQGAIVIAACGNSSNPSCIYPAVYDNVIAVGATRYDETLAYYSNYGSDLDLVAPGGDLNVDQNSDGYGDGVLQQTFTITNWGWWRTINWGYYFYRGTSMAAPHVSGVVALLIATGSAVTPDEVKIALQETAKCLPSGEICPNDIYGYGIIDAYAALQWTAAPAIACLSDVDCDDSNPCAENTCVNPGTVDAYCQDTIIADNTPCDDGLWCTVNNTCAAGLCVGEERDCSDANECTINSCNETFKACENTPVADNTECVDGVCCSGVCEIGLTECFAPAICWQGSNSYLYWNNSQAAKFCKCASGAYGFNSYSIGIAMGAMVYQYVDIRNNESWEVTSRSSNLSVYQVRCRDGLTYSTNQDYYYPK